MVARTCQVYCAAAVVGPSLRVGSSFDEDLGDGCLACARGDVKHSAALAVGGGDRGFSRQEPAHHGDTATSSCGHQGREGRRGWAELGARGLEDGCRRHVVSGGGDMKPRTLRRPHHRVGILSCLEQCSCGVVMPRSEGRAQRSSTRGIGSGRLGTCLKEQVEHCDVAPCRSVKERRCARVVDGIGCGTLGQEELDDVGLARAGCSVEGRGLGAIRKTGISAARDEASHRAQVAAPGVLDEGPAALTVQRLDLGSGGEEGSSDELGAHGSLCTGHEGVAVSGHALGRGSPREEALRHRGFPMLDGGEEGCDTRRTESVDGYITSVEATVDLAEVSTPGGVDEAVLRRDRLRGARRGGGQSSAWAAAHPPEAKGQDSNPHRDGPYTRRCATRRHETVLRSSRLAHGLQSAKACFVTETELESPPSTPPARTAGCMQPFILLVVGGLLLGGVAAGALAGRFTAPEAPSAKTEVVYRSPAVVTAIQRLARLETARFHMERVIDLKSKQKAMMGLLDTEDAILLVAAADVTAGIDLAKLSDDDVEIDRERGRVSVRLPAPEVFDAVLDEKRTYVYRRDTGVMADRDGDLETKARRLAVDDLTEAARRAGILDLARDQGRKTMTSLVLSLGYDEVEVTFDEPDPQG